MACFKKIETIGAILLRPVLEICEEKLKAVGLTKKESRRHNPLTLSISIFLQNYYVSSIRREACLVVI